MISGISADIENNRLGNLGGYVRQKIKLFSAE